MNDLHSSPQDLAAYFRGLLDAESARAVEAHCAACDACADKLAAEARLEVALYAVVDQIRADAPAERPAVRTASAGRSRSQVRRAVVAGAFLAAAAAALLVMRAAPPGSTSISKDRPTSSPSFSANESPPPMRTPLATAAATATTMFVLSAPMPGCTNCASTLPALPAQAASAPASASSASIAVVSAADADAGPRIRSASLEASAPANEITIHVGEIRQMRITDIDAYHLDATGVVDVTFRDDDVLFDGKKAGSVGITFIGRNHSSTQYLFHVVDFAATPAPTPIELRVGEARSFQLPNIQTYHLSQADVVQVLFHDDTVLVEAKKPGTTGITFFAEKNVESMYIFHVSAAAKSDAGDASDGGSDPLTDRH